MSIPAVGKKDNDMLALEGFSASLLDAGWLSIKNLDRNCTTSFVIL